MKNVVLNANLLFSILRWLYRVGAARPERGLQATWRVRPPPQPLRLDAELDLDRRQGRGRRRGRGRPGDEAASEVYSVRVLAAVPGLRAAVQEEDGPHAEAHMVRSSQLGLVCSLEST